MSTSNAPPSPKLHIEAISAGSDAYPKPEGVTFGYGTAGFRTKSNTLHSTLFRVGLLAALRSKRLEGRTVGVMITASHNPAEDNGVKLVDPHGEMLDALWEPLATALSNHATTSELISALPDLLVDTGITAAYLARPAKVVIGRDTRESGEGLVEALKAGLKAMGLSASSSSPEAEREGEGGIIDDRGILTTPQLHWIVKGSNLSGEEGKAWGEVSEEGYLRVMEESFARLMSGKGKSSPLIIDCANGVGTIALEKFSPRIAHILPITLVCTETSDPTVLNARCGADFVKTQQKCPAAMAPLMKAGSRACSLDGDADRVVYYYHQSSQGEGGAEGEGEGRFRLLDGDKIATLAASFIGDLVKQAGLLEQVKIGVVQTAYANGNSTANLHKAGLPVKCVPTGVKHLHHAAEKYDIGVYFEANGHGTVLFSPETLDLLKAFEPQSPAQDTAVNHLRALTVLVNQAVGDAISDLLLVEVILAHRKWGAAEWDQGYEDLPNRLVKVNVPDRAIFRTEDAERRLTSPPGLQARVDEVVRKFEKGRSFVRPSGTEDCVRVYAEASTRTGTNELAAAVTQLVEEAASGRG